MAKIGSNIFSLRLQGRFASIGKELERTTQQLASGQRIVSPSVDAAGAAVGSALSVQGRIYNQATRNLNDGISAINIQESALNQLSEITIRQKELAEQAANGSLSSSQRQSLNKEANALAQEFNRIIASTSFNGRNLLQSGNAPLVLQAGAAQQEIIQTSGTEALERLAGTGLFNVASSSAATATNPDIAAGDLNGDGKQDLVTIDSNTGNRVTVHLGNGDGTFAATTYGPSNATNGLNAYVDLGDINGDRRIDVVALVAGQFQVFVGNGDGTFQNGVNHPVCGAGSSAEEVTVGDFNGDGFDDVMAMDGDIGEQLHLSRGDGTFTDVFTGISGLVYTSTGHMAVADFNSDGKDEFLAQELWSNDAVIYQFDSNGNPTVMASLACGGLSDALTAEDLNGDGNNDFVFSKSGSLKVYLGNGNGTFGQMASYTLSASGAVCRSLKVGDFNNDGFADVSAEAGGNTINTIFGRGDGAFSGPTASSSSSFVSPLTFGDFDQDGVLDLVGFRSGPTTLTFFKGDTTSTTTAQNLELQTAAGAGAAIGVLDAQLNRIEQQMAETGASRSRAAVALNLTSSRSVEVQTAASRILDVDMASATAEFLRLKILQESTAAVAAHANQDASLVLGLLR